MVPSKVKGIDRNSIIEEPKQLLTAHSSIGSVQKEENGKTPSADKGFWSSIGQRLLKIKDNIPDINLRSTFYDNNPLLKTQFTNAETDEQQESKPYRPFSKLSIFPYSLESCQEIVKFWDLDEI